MYVKVSRGFHPSCKNCGASALRGFCPTGLLPYNHQCISLYVNGSLARGLSQYLLVCLQSSSHPALEFGCRAQTIEREQVGMIPSIRKIVCMRHAQRKDGGIQKVNMRHNSING